MGFEAASFVDGLVATNPLGTDDKAEGDNHFRLIKTVLKATFPNSTKAFRFPQILSKSADYVMLFGDDNSLVLVNSTAANRTISLPDTGTISAGFETTIFKQVAANSVIVDTPASETINGANTFTLTAQYEYLKVRWDGTTWNILSQRGILADNNTFTGINTYTKIQKWSKGADVASAGALTLGDDGNYFDITGTTTITSIGTKGVGTVVKLHFDGALILTHHATDLILPGAANITTAAGDEAEFVEYATGDWRCVSYSKASGTAVVAPSVTRPFLGTLFTSTDQTITSAGPLTLPHGLASAPTHISASLVCQTGENGYSAGNIVPIHTTTQSPDAGFACVVDGTNLNIKFGSSASAFRLTNFTTGANAGMTNANWKIRFYAWY